MGKAAGWLAERLGVDFADAGLLAQALTHRSHGSPNNERLEYLGDATTPESAAALAAQSPMAHVDRVRTPTLVIHSELDFRCPLEQATRYYAALKRHGTETEMLVFPGENHELTRSGQPRHRVQRFDAVLAWWAKHLPAR